MSGRSRGKAACPICGASSDDSSTTPFCSERCRLVDLGRWLDGDYRIPVEPAPPSPSPSRGSA